MNKSLYKKYDIPCPRYTSYPTVPMWDTYNFSAKKWKSNLSQSLDKDNAELSIYIHLPFCESLCTYCGCNKRITKNHKVEERYIQSLLSEWEMYINLLPVKPTIKELHLGGGTPTFFSAQNLEKLIIGIESLTYSSLEKEYSIEVHPNVTSEEQIKTLARLGFSRISLGVQDFDPIVQRAIHRVQTFEQTKKIHDWAKEYGFQHINYDIIFGLPFQTTKSIQHTIEKVNQLSPGRIAFYSYAHVPWKSKSQRGFDENDLPSADEKRALYNLGKRLLQDNRYVEIGMDHFALPEDPLYKAYTERRLHRNFMGYTIQDTDLLIGLGASSISDSGSAFSQNVKGVEEYQNTIENGQLPIERGHILDHSDLIIKEKIKTLMCNHEADFNTAIDFVNQELMTDLINDGLVILSQDKLKVTSKGENFIRNICFAIDERYWAKQPQTNLFSKAV